MHWRIEESVGQGMYILLPGLFTTKENAETAITKERSNKNMRAALYQEGKWDGDERIEVTP